jgi:hypothetical protein
MSSMSKKAFRESVNKFARLCEEYVSDVLVIIHDKDDALDMTAEIIMRRVDDEWRIPIGVSGDGAVSIVALQVTEGYLPLTKEKLFLFLWDKTYRMLCAEQEQHRWLVEQKNAAYAREAEFKAMLQTIEANGYPNHPVDEWQKAVANGVTRMGYAHWVIEQMKFKPNCGIAAK